MKPTDDIRKLLSEKFKNFEAEPQDNSWENICFSLDLKDKFKTYQAEPQEDTLSKILLATQLTDKFKDYEVEPQEDTFNKILLAAQLTEKFKDYEAEPLIDSDESIIVATLLRDKFNNYEAEPQADTWAAIQLATQLTEKFSNFETEPKTESWEKIKAAITPEKEHRIIFWPFAYRVGIAAGVVLLLSFGWLLFNDDQQSELRTTINKNTQSADNQVITAKKGQGLVVNKPKNNSNLEKEINNNKIDFTKSEVVEQSNDLSGVASNGRTKKDFNRRESLHSADENHATKIIRKKAKKSFNDNLEKTILHENIAQSNNPVVAIDIQNSVSDVASTTNVINQTNNNIELKVLGSKDFKTKNIRLPFGEITYNNELPIEEPKERVRRKMILTSSIMPLQTYQALIILPQTTSYIQQVGTLNALDAQRLGVQVRVGIMQPISNRFSTGLSLTYAGIRQSVSYEVNNGIYDVDLTSNDYTLVGIGESVSQNKFLHTAGLKLDNSYLISNKKNKVFILGGAEAVSVLNDNQYAYYLNASVALAYPIKGGKTVWIEPTYRYSLSQSLDANNYLQIRPSNIGLNIRVNLM